MRQQSQRPKGLGAIVLLLLLALNTGARAAFNYDISVTGGFEGHGQISFTSASGDSRPDPTVLNRISSFFFTVTAQPGFVSPPAGPGEPAPLPFTFNLSDIGAAQWIIDAADGSLSLFLAFEPLRIDGNAYDIAFDTIGESNNQVDCFLAVFRPPSTAAFCSSSQEPFGRFSTGSVEFSPAPTSVPLDIKPQGCPNPLNTKSKGVTPVAILGTADFDVTQIDIASLRLEGVAAIRSTIEDVATPFTPTNGLDDALACTDLGPDGIDDLTLKFDTQALIQGLGDVQDGEVRVLTLTGVLQDGAPLEGHDVVVIKAKGGGNN